MSESVLIRDLAGLSAGPELGAALAQVSLDALELSDRIDVAVAQARLAHDQAQLWQTLASIVDLEDGTVFTRVDDEIRMALCWTRTTTSAQLGTAVSLRDRLPDTLRAVSEGRIHAKVAEAIDTGTAHLPLDEARQVEAKVLTDIAAASVGCDGIGGLTTGQVRDRLNRLAHQVDPEAATRRYEKALADRRVEGWCESDGTANLAGRNLPLDQAALAKDRVDAITTTIVAAGASDGRTLTQIRADVFLGLLTGQITAPTAIAAAPPAPAAAAPSVPAAAAPSASAAGTSAASAAKAGRSGGVELVITAETLMGLDGQPGHLSGWGPIGADIARQLADQLRHAPWRWTVTDPATGHVIGHGSLRRRPDTGTDSYVRSRDRLCRNPRCRAPAHHTDLDHTIAHTDGGPTEDYNLGALCRHDHRLKHTPGWTLTQPTPGTFEWTTPSGHTYRAHLTQLTRPTPHRHLDWAPDWRQLLRDQIRQVALAA